MSCNASKADLETLLKRLETIEKAVTETRKIESKTEEKSLTDEIVQPAVKPVAEPTPAPKPEPVVDNVTKTDEPLRKDFDCPIEFNKAYTKWLTEKEAETPVTKADLAKFLSDLEEKLLKAVPGIKIEGDLTLGEAVKKSIPVARNPTAPVDFNQWIKSATEVSASAVTMGVK